MHERPRPVNLRLTPNASRWDKAVPAAHGSPWSGFCLIGLRRGYCWALQLHIGGGFLAGSAMQDGKFDIGDP